MRILFTFAGGSGHFNPLIPIAQAAEAAGHVVAFAGRPWMIPVVEAAGFRGFASGTDVGGTPKRIPLRAFDPEREDRGLREGFARRIARERARDIFPLCLEWQPDLLVCEEMDFGPMMVAERLGLPHASVLVIAASSFVRHALVAEPLNELRAEYGLPPDPELVMLHRYLVLSPFPPSFRDPAFPLPITGHALRLPVPESVNGETVPPCAAPLPGVPTVYFTLGTVFNVECGDLYVRVLKGLRDLPINLIVTVGRHVDPEELGPQPGHVQIERYIPQSLILPRCSLVVSHGGSGSVLGALAHGLPMVVLPMGADQPLNAARCEALGLARVLDPVAATPESLREAVSAILADPAYRRAAERLRDESAALPGPAHAMALIERLTAETGR